jgi:signal transduction histidine kinase
MSSNRPVWYRSLYWRIAFGFVALLAVVLVLQVIIFLWLTDRIVGPSSKSPQQLATNLAAEIAADLGADPTLRLDPYLRDKFGHIFQPFLVVLQDGQFGSNRFDRLPPGFARAVLPRWRRGGRFGEPGRGGEPWRFGEAGRGGGPPDGRGGTPEPGPPPDGRGPRPDRMGPPPGGRGDRPPPPEPRVGDRPPESEMHGGGGRRFETAPITVNGADVGAVIVPAEAPPVFVAVREMGPTLAWFALALLGVGAAVTALVIFRPTHNRLRALEQAATALGQGQTEVRAVESGGDEVSSLARTFNRMAEDLEARATALSASDRARRQLLADVSHELMTPLTAIRGYTETLGMGDLQLDEGTRGRYLAIIGEETLKLEELIGDLLDLARLEGGGGTLAFKDVAIADLFGRVVDRHGPTTRERRITIARRIDPEDLEVRGDPQRLEQALQNLASNALRHTPDGGSIELRASASGNGVRIGVADSGPGIPPEHLPRVFDRFYKADPSRSVSAASSGSGLGLSIVKAIVERHGGTISAVNTPSGGAMFEIVLPSQPSTQADRNTDSRSASH